MLSLLVGESCFLCTFRRMCARPSNAVFASWWILFFVREGISSWCFSRLLLLEFLLLLVPLWLSCSTFSVFLTSDPGSLLFYLIPFLSTMCVSVGSAISILSPSFCLPVTVQYGLRVCIYLPVLILKSHSTLFSVTGLGLWSRMLSVVLISPGWHKLWWIAAAKLLCLVQASCYIGARTHYVSYCLIPLFAHAAF